MRKAINQVSNIAIGFISIIVGIRVLLSGVFHRFVPGSGISVVAEGIHVRIGGLLLLLVGLFLIAVSVKDWMKS